VAAPGDRHRLSGRTRRRGDFLQLLDGARLDVESTRVALSCECTSLTSVPVSRAGINEAVGARTASGRATHAPSGAAAIAVEAIRKWRRFISVIGFVLLNPNAKTDRPAAQ